MSIPKTGNALKKIRKIFPTSLILVWLLCSLLTNSQRQPCSPAKAGTKCSFSGHEATQITLKLGIKGKLGVFQVRRLVKGFSRRRAVAGGWKMEVFQMLCPRVVTSQWIEVRLSIFHIASCSVWKKWCLLSHV